MPAWGTRCSDNPYQDDQDYEPLVCPIGQKACGNECNKDPNLQCLDFSELWSESFMEGFTVDLSADHKIDEGFDERLMSFVAQKGMADMLFPLTQQRMVLFGYISALKKLSKFLDSLFEFNPERDLPPHTHYSNTGDPKDKETSLDPPLRDLMVGSGRSIDDDDKSVACPSTFFMNKDLNWKQRNGTHFKRHVFENMHVLPQYLTTKSWDGGTLTGYLWKSIFFIAEEDSESYMGERAVNLYKDAYHAAASEDFDPVQETPKTVAVAWADEDGFYNAIGEALGLNKDDIKFELHQDSWLDENMQAKCYRMDHGCHFDPGCEDPDPCPDSMFTKYTTYTNFVAVNRAVYPKSPKETTEAFRATASDRLKFLETRLQSYDTEVIGSAIEVAALLVATGNDQIESVMQYMDAVDGVREVAAQKELAQRAFTESILLMILETAALAVVPGVGELMAGTNLVWKGLRATAIVRRLSTVGSSIKDFQGLAKVSRIASTLGDDVRKMVAALKGALPPRMQKALTRANEFFKKVSKGCSCLALNFGLQEGYSIPLNRLLDAPHERLLSTAPLLKLPVDSVALLPHPLAPANASTHKDAVFETGGAESASHENTAAKLCFIKWKDQKTSFFRDSRVNQKCKDNLTGKPTLCRTAAPPYYAYTNTWAPCGLDVLNCDHILELGEFSYLAGKFGNLPTTSRDQICKWAADNDINRRLYQILNSEDDLMGVDSGKPQNTPVAAKKVETAIVANPEVFPAVNQQKKNMVRGKVSKTSSLHQESVYGALDEYFKPGGHGEQARANVMTQLEYTMSGMDPTGAHGASGIFKDWRNERVARQGLIRDQCAELVKDKNSLKADLPKTPYKKTPVALSAISFSGNDGTYWAKKADQEVAKAKELAKKKPINYKC
ncbi:hypothetical protein HDU88_004004 [Geranomyces variabilis]|nr:hypothetical protein HDU88_004004 [Geranomyces variabilis]